MKKRSPKKRARSLANLRRPREPKRRDRTLIHIPEPLLTFAFGQEVEDPRDGLLLFGPLDRGKPFGIRVAVIGTDRGLALYQGWVRRIQGHLSDEGSPIARPPFPGFETVFRIPWGSEPALKVP